MFHRFWSDSIWCVSDPFHLHPWSMGQWVCVRFWGSVYGQGIATWAEVTPKGNFLRESYPKFRLRIYCKLQWIAQMYIYCILIYKYIVRPREMLLLAGGCRSGRGPWRGTVSIAVSSMWQLKKWFLPEQNVYIISICNLKVQLDHTSVFSAYRKIVLPYQSWRICFLISFDWIIVLMEEIPHHLGCIKPCE